MRQRDVHILLLLAAAILFIVIILGRMEFHNELQRDILQNTFLGYLDESQYTGTVTIVEDQWPEWTEALEKEEKTKIVFSAGEMGRVGIFADLVYYENRYERRTWFSGRLLERKSEYYYKPDGRLRLQPVYVPLQKIVEVDQIKAVDYNYQNFCGN